MHRPVQAALDHSPLSLLALDWATEEAAQRHVPLEIVHAHAWASPSPASARAQQTRSRTESFLATVMDRARRRTPGVEIGMRLVAGDPRQAVMDCAADAAMLVLGTRGGGGFPGLLVGSTSLYAAAHAPCPVVVVPSRPAQPRDEGHGGVIVGIHGRVPSARLLRLAFEAALRQKAPLTVTRAFPSPSDPTTGTGLFAFGHGGGGTSDLRETRILTRALEGWREQYPGIDVIEDLTSKRPEHRLVELSEHAGLVVLGHRSLSFDPVRRLGTVTQAVLRHARCPVAVVPLSPTPPRQADHGGRH
ncbi:universal stress protein [Streptomyces sp. NPDC051776]|uniref:universal stress protein n=1 Tax=Streptomyces sp. NPDC051776 TaxID=3155414 RepID=UPI0034130E6C